MAWTGKPFTNIPSLSEVTHPLPEFTYLPIWALEGGSHLCRITERLGRGAVGKAALCTLPVPCWVLSHLKAHCGSDLCSTLLLGPLPLPPWLLGAMPGLRRQLFSQVTACKNWHCVVPVIFLRNKFRRKLNNFFNLWFDQK